MFPRSPLIILPLLALAVAILPIGCKVNERAIEEQDRYFKEEPVRVPEVHLNRLAAEPTAFLRSRSADPVHWQPWSPELLERSRLEQKPIFAFVTGGHFPRTYDILDQLTGDPQKVRILHSHYLCTLVDINVHPEMGLLAHRLSEDIKRVVAFPFMAWFTHEGNAFAWLPLRQPDIDTFDSIFESAHEMVREIWNDDARYVVMNSRRDNAKRSKQIRAALDEHFHEPADLSERLRKAARALSALYDPTSGQIDHNGGLVPFSILQFAATCANHPDTSPTLRKRLLLLLEGHSALLRKSAIHDPLDGGYFFARRSQHGWSLPTFMKVSATQLEGVIAFSGLTGLAEEGQAAEATREVLGFVDSRLTRDAPGIGLYEVPPKEAESAGIFLWPREDLEALLSAEEFAVVEKCYGIKGIGNIPSEADQRRDFFRLNSLSLAATPAAAASELGLSAERAAELLDSARQRLLVRRRERVERGEPVVETARVTAINARYVTALLAASASTGDPDRLTAAKGVLDELRTHHYSGTEGLMRIPAREGRRGIPARGQDYACLLEALFSIYRHDPDPAHLVWAVQLADEVIARLSDEDGLLREAPPQHRIHTVPLYSSAMIFGRSTWGTIFGPLMRLELLTGSQDYRKVREGIAWRLPGWFETVPLQHTDFGSNALAAVSETVVYLQGARESAELEAFLAVLREPSHATITMVHLSPELPSSFTVPPREEAGPALVMKGGKQIGTASNPAELRALLVSGGTPE